MVEMTCAGLAERLGYECRRVGDSTIHVSTPFTFADGEPISFYIEDHGRDITVFDNADTLIHLSGIGWDISDRKKWKGIRQIYSSFGLDLNDAGIVIGKDQKSGEESLITRYICAAMAVADLEREYLGLTDEQAIYIQEVEDQLMAWKPGVALLRYPMVQGHSGRDHSFHFDFDNALIDAARPHGARTGSILRKSADVMNSGNPKSILVVMDDREDSDRARAETDILSTMVSVIAFTVLARQASSNGRLN